MNIALSKIQLRITALWAFSEALLGGILHGYHVPFAGLILSAFASVCMAALAFQDNSRGKILKATILVIIVKAILSPHTPPTAYFAVFLQGLFGELIFSVGISYFASCMSNSIFALLQTAFQKLIVLTILFGTGFWKALDDFMNNVSHELGIENVSYSYIIVVLFILLHLITGIIAGIFSGRLPKLMLSPENKLFTALINSSPSSAESKTASPIKNRFNKPITWILFFLLIALLYKMYVGKGFEDAIKSKVLKLLIRSTLILVLWYFFISPFLLNWFRKWIMIQKSKFSTEVENILLLIPEMKTLTQHSWTATANIKGFRRISKFISYTFYSIIAVEK